MSTYAGWERDLLEGASQPVTSHNRRFLTAWNKASLIDCALNPVDLTDKTHGSKNCKAARVPGRHNVHYQSYPHGGARAAFKKQLGSGHYPNLLVAIAQGNPYDTSKITPDIAAKIETELAHWGSAAFGAEYAQDMSQGGPPPPPLKAPQALKGWADLQRSVNRKMPAALAASQRSRNAALRELARIRKVHI